jgi:cytochrome c peroxidase
MSGIRFSVINNLLLQPRKMSHGVACTVALATVFGATPASSHDEVNIFTNSTGVLELINTNGRTDKLGAFFQSLGTNGRSCSTCHVGDQAMSISPSQIRERYERTNGRDPLFASVDGANCSNVKRTDRSGHSLLLKHGLIRIPINIPATAQFTISVVKDPYGCALVSDPKTGLLTASVYRRPLPTANVNFLSVVMWDGRETLSPLTSGATFMDNLKADLKHQAISAVSVHAEGTATPTDAQLEEIAGYEMGVFTAQVWDWKADRLDRGGGLGGARNLAEEQYYPGINDVLGADPNGLDFDSSSMSLFAAWANPDDYSRKARARADIAAGEKLFNTAALTISNVRGLNDSPALNRPTSFQGTCTTCHDAPNVGDHSLPLPLDIGVAHTGAPGLESDPLVAKGVAELDEPNLPVFLINGCPNPFNPGQPASFYTTDPGKALVTGLCNDLNRLKGPVLRGLAARAPYFHNGTAATLLDAVNFYNQRFQMNLTAREKQQLVAFLNSL